MPNLSDLIRSKLDVRQDSGDDWLCICPWHPDTSPSLRVNVKKGLYICHACGTRGGRSSLLMRLGISPSGPREEPQQIHARALSLRSEAPRRLSKTPRLPESLLASFGVIETPYWTERGFSAEVQSRFDLGYDLNSNSGTIPVRTLGGDLVAIIRRKLEPGAIPKYKYQKGFPMSQYLWGAWEVRVKSIAICEGPLDAVALWDAGIEAVALNGCQLSRYQEATLKRMDLTKVTLFLDNDKAGAKATEEISARLSRSFVVGTVDYGDIAAKDPGELTLRQRTDLYVNSVRRLARPVRIS